MSKFKDTNFTITGINAVGLVSLLAYTVRTFNEVNSNIDNLRFELENIKKNNGETSKRSNIALNHLNEKIDNNFRMLNSNKNTPMKKKSNKIRDNKPIYIREEEEEQDISNFSSFSNNDEISGALSELLGH